jgi:Fe-S-cluster containining protein
VRLAPWWSAGIRFACQPECGACCDQPGGVVFLSRSDIHRLAVRHGLTDEAYVERDCTTSQNGRLVLRSRVEDGICIYLGADKRCGVYADRPQQCAAFPWWSENLVNRRAWSQVKSTCPGIDAQDAFLVDGSTILRHIEADLEAGQGVFVPLSPHTSD